MIDLNQDIEKSEELKSILFELARSQELMESDSARDQMYTKLEGLYYLPKSKENYRHLYSDVFSTIIAIKDDPTKGNIDILAQNLKMLWEKYQVKNKYENGDMINVSESIRKLYDHVSLDMARLTYSDYQKEISSLNEQVSDVKEEITQAQNAQNDL